MPDAWVFGRPDRRNQAWRQLAVVGDVSTRVFRSSAAMRDRPWRADADFSDDQ